MLTKQQLFGNNDRYRRDPTRPGSANPQSVAPVMQPQMDTAKIEPSKPEPSRSEFASTTAPTEAKGSKLIVGPDIKLKGAEITDCDTLVVEGRVEASMDSRVIQIAENGAFQGNVGIDIAEIRGRFDGELTARKQLVVYATGKVSGKIRYGSIVIEQGGELSGDIATLALPKPVAMARPSNEVVPNRV
jgi:cytoskeletal protein CcmA (bactofilin family)